MNLKPSSPTSLLCAAASLFTPLAAQETPYNVLLITVDDLRPELPAYGQGHIHAPNMTRLTDEGLTFNRAYVQQAVCQPARANVLTGARPDTTRIYSVFGGGWPTFRNTMGAVDTLPSLFKDNGYWTAGYGKNFHHVDLPSWDEHTTFYQTADLYQRPENRAVAGDASQRPAWEFFDDALESNTMDAKVAAAAVQAIRDRADDGSPFFIAAGFWKPHLPFSAPQKYWDLYDRETLPIAEGLDALPVQNALPAGFYDPFSGELTTYQGGRPPFVGQTAETQAALANGTFTTNQQTGDDWGIITVNGTHIYPEDYVREITHGYYACVSFIDAQIGKILDALEEEDLLDNTIIVLWGDHGMHVGQHGSWPKHTNMEIATRFPFILHHPDMPSGTRGVLTDALVESVDIMPTLLELAGVPLPTTHALEGVSLVPLMDEPGQTWKTAAFSQYPREVPMNSGIWYMGYAMRTATHTYMQWREMDATDGNPISLAQRNFTISNRVAYEELYDMVIDQRQNHNIGGDPQYRALMDALGEKISTALTTEYANTQNVASADPAAPGAHAVAFHGGTSVGDTLTAHYIYGDANGDLENGTLIEWVRAEDFNGPYDTVVGTGSTYTLQADDADAFVKLRVTPQTDVAPTTGDAVLSATAVVAGVGFNDGSGLPAPESAVYEGFAYASGVISSTSAGGRGWNGGWWGNDGLSFGGNSGAQAVDFTWNHLPEGYHHTPAGRAATNGANSNNPYRQLHGAQTIDLAQNGTRYFSFLYQHNGSAPTFEKRFHAGTTEILKLQINADGSLGLITPDETAMGLLTLDADSAYVVLGRIQSAASGNDTLSVSVYKAGDTVPASPPVFAASVSVNSSATLDRVFMGNPFNGSNTGNSPWDEFHMDANYAAVVGTPDEEDDGGSGHVPPFLTERFDYNAGGIASGNAGGTGWDGGWFGNAELTFGGNSGAAAADKTWSTPDGYHYIPEGRAATNNNHGNTPFRKLAAGSTINLGSDTVYFSFLFSHASTSMFEYRFYAGTSEITKLQVDQNGQLRLVGTDFLPTGLNLTAGQDYLITGKIEGNAAGNDTLSVQVYGSGDTVPADEPAFTHSVTFQSSSIIDRLMIGIPGSTTTSATYWDEIRMGTTWGSVIGAASDGENDGDDDEDPDDPPPPPAELMLHLTFDEGTLADSSPAALNVTGTVGYATADGRSYATLNGVDQAITAPILGSFPNGLSIAFWTLAQDGENGMPKNTALGWARQGGTTGSLGDGLVLGFGWNNSTNALVRVGRENNINDDISLPELTDWLNTWVHWTVVKDPAAGTIQVYRDGELYSSVSNRTIIPAFESQSWATGSGLRIGRYFDDFYKGYLDDYRLYHGVLDSAAVQAIYQEGGTVDRSLANTVRRLTHDQALNVVFFGGSITDGAGQNNGLPWRTRTENWFSATYPDVDFAFTNASISGTTSEFGVFRADRHVLSAEPDLVFVEFAVNDIEQVSATRTRHTMEGIVRKIRSAHPACDIVFIYTTTRANAVNFYEQDQLPPRTAVHQEVADHYGIPVIDVAAALVAHKHQTGYPYRIEFGEPGAFDPAANHYLPDHVHPSNLGHQVYGDAIQAALETYFAIPPPDDPEPHPMPELFGGYDMSSARILDHTHPGVSHGAGWAVQAMGIGAGGRTDDFLFTDAASTTSNITVHFSGPEFGVYYRRMTNGGQIAWDVDSGAAGNTFSFWHETLTSFTSQAMLSTALGEGNHVAVIDPQAYEGHETLAIAGWLVTGEHTGPSQLNYTDWADSVYAHLDGGAAHPEAAPDFVPPGGRLSNLQIFAYGGTPETPPPPPALTPVDDYPELIFSRRADGAASPVFFHATELISGSWSDAGLQILSITPAGDGIREEVRVRSPLTLTDQPLQFFAVHVEAD